MKGVAEARADFPKRRLEIVFEDQVVTEKRIAAAAKGLGFTLAESGAAKDAPQR